MNKFSIRNWFDKNGKGIVLIICSSLLACMGQLFWKLFADGNWLYFIIGTALYGIGALLMIISYKYGSLSVLQPMLSMNYVFAIFLGNLVLDEPILCNKLVGIIIIMFGVVMIAGGET